MNFENINPHIISLTKCLSTLFNLKQRWLVSPPPHRRHTLLPCLSTKANSLSGNLLYQIRERHILCNKIMEKVMIKTAVGFKTRTSNIEEDMSFVPTLWPTMSWAHSKLCNGFPFNFKRCVRQIYKFDSHFFDRTFRINRWSRWCVTMGCTQRCCFY